MVPIEYRCSCDGEERPATAAEQRAAGACNAVYTMCEGKVSACEDPRETINRLLSGIDAGPDVDAAGYAQ